MREYGTEELRRRGERRMERTKGKDRHRREWKGKGEIGEEEKGGGSKRKGEEGRADSQAGLGDTRSVVRCTTRPSEEPQGTFPRALASSTSPPPPLSPSPAALGPHCKDRGGLSGSDARMPTLSCSFTVLSL